MRVLLRGAADSLEGELAAHGIELVGDTEAAEHLVTVAPPVELAPLVRATEPDAWLRTFDAWATDAFFAAQPWLAAALERGSGALGRRDVGRRHPAVPRRRRRGGRRDGAAHARPGCSARRRPARRSRERRRARLAGRTPRELDPGLAVADTPLRRLAAPADIAAAVAWLLSPAAAHVTGEIVRVDGGYTITRGSRPDPRRQ